MAPAAPRVTTSPRRKRAAIAPDRRPSAAASPSFATTRSTSCKRSRSDRHCRREIEQAASAASRAPAGSRPRSRSRGTSIWTTRMRAADRADSSGTWSERTLALAPDATAIMFSPASDTMIAAQPVGCRDASHQPGDRSRRGAAGRAQRRQRHVAANRADHRDLGSGTARGQRLIGALAAGKKRVIAAEHGLARPRQVRDRHDQIDIDRAEDDNHARRPFPSRWRLTVNRSSGRGGMPAPVNLRE